MNLGVENKKAVYWLAALGVAGAISLYVNVFSGSGSTAPPKTALVTERERILRRGYNFDEGLDAGFTESVAGLFFLAYQRDPRAQFVPIQSRLAAEDRLNEQARRLDVAISRLRESWNRERDPEKSREHVREAVAAAREINWAIETDQVRGRVQHEWDVLRAEVNRLAAVFHEPQIRWER